MGGAHDIRTREHYKVSRLYGFGNPRAPLNKMRGQCYDGASSMSGAKTGVAKQISDIESRAIFTHCYGHTLNLACSDVVKGCKILRDTLETAREITKLIKFSPKREAIFQEIKKIS